MPVSDKTSQGVTRSGNYRTGYRMLDNHPKKKQIITDLILQKPYREIAKKYSLNVQTIRNWQKEQLAKTLVDEKFQYSAKDQLDWINNECKKIIAACKRELGDIDNPDEYDFSPSSEEVEVQYVKIVPGTTIKTPPRRESITDILERMENNGALPIKIYYNKVDSRRILLEALKLAKSNIETIAKLTGELSEITINQQMNTQVNIDMAGVIIPKLMEAIRNATREEPEIGVKISDAIYEIVEATSEPSGS